MQYHDLGPQQRIVMGRHGKLLVNLNDIYIGNAVALYGEYGEIEWQFMQQVIPAGRDLVEVGANIGTHSLPLALHAARQGRRLLAIEAQPVIFQTLCANLALNQIRNVQAENLACANATGWVHFMPPDYAQEGNFGGVRMSLEHGEAPAHAQRIRSLPLDDVLDHSWDVGFLKIDVEGFEQLVLQGAQQTIARCRPVIYLENDQVDKSQALIEQLWSMHYKLWWHVPALFNPGNFAGESRNIYDDKVSINMLCIPQETPVAAATPALTNAAYHPLKK